MCMTKPLRVAGHLALRFLTKAIDRKGKLGLINIDRSGAHTAAIHQYNHDHCKRTNIRQCKSLNNIVELEGG
jgi:transposase-like protein